MNKEKFRSDSVLEKECMNYRVEFVGYGAYIIRRRGQACVGTIDFVSGATKVFVDAAEISLSTPEEFLPFVSTVAGFIREKGNFRRLRKNEGMEWVTDDHKMTVDVGCDLMRVVKRVDKVAFALAAVLLAAHLTGAQFQREPYADFLARVRSAGYARIELHGNGIFNKARGFMMLKPSVPDVFAFINLENSVVITRDEPKIRPGLLGPIHEAEIAKMQFDVAMAGVQYVEFSKDVVKPRGVTQSEVSAA